MTIKVSDFLTLVTTLVIGSGFALTGSQVLDVAGLDRKHYTGKNRENAFTTTEILDNIKTEHTEAGKTYDRLLHGKTVTLDIYEQYIHQGL